MLRESPRDGATNRITGSPYAYDANGNMTNDGSNTLVYDAENRVLSATNGSTSGSYTYDGNNLRVKKVSGSTATVYIFSGSKVIAEYDNGTAPSSPSREYVYSGGALLAKIDSAGTKYYHQDHLSNRLVTDLNGNTLAQLGHYPFGESWYNASNDKLQFTTYERGAESGNDYAMMRSYVNRLARFSFPDPVAGSPGNPQSLNRYPYVHNDPINSVDPGGLRGHPYYFCTPGANSQFSTSCNPGGDLFGGNCAVDGIATSCRIVQSLLGAGAAVQCPNNICEGVNQDGLPVRLAATEVGSGYACLLSGSFNTQRSAGIAAANCAIGLSSAYGAEYCGNLYQADSDGSFSFTSTSGEVHACSYDPSDIPDQSEYAGFYHTHSYGVPINEQFSGADLNIGGGLENLLFPTYLGTPEGRIIMFDPSLILHFPEGCVLQGSPVSAIPDTRPAIPLCH